MASNKRSALSGLHLAFGIVYVVLLSISGVSAAKAQEAGGGLQSVDIVEAIHDSTTQELQYQELFTQNLKDALAAMKEHVARTSIAIKEDTSKQQKLIWSFSSNLKDMLRIREFDKLSLQMVENRLNAANYGFYSGYGIVENMDLADSDNPLTKGTGGAVDRYFYDLYMKNFCIEDSSTDTEHCTSGNVTNPPSFHEFFIADTTWPEAKVLDVMRMASRFFSGADTREAITKDLGDRSNFIEARAKQARANMRMAVLNNLAARRAPVSRNASLAMSVMIQTYDTTGQLRFRDVESICALSDPRPAEAHICSMLSKPIDSDGTRLISQAVVDRIMQHDLHMSPFSYDNINAVDDVDGSLDRYEIALKAQLVTQAYREIELLKMKTALYAMNMMSK